MQLNDAIEKRRSIRRFGPKKPNWRDVIEAIDAGNKAPQAGNISSVKFIMVDDEQKIQEITNACQQDFVGEAQFLIIICSDPTLVVKSYYETGEIYCRQQAGAAIENILLKIVDLGLGTCWVGLFDERLVKRALKIPENINVEAILPVGYSIDHTPRKRRIPLDRTLFFNTYGNKEMKPKKRVEAI